jgi:signal transduction histidine kinase
MLFLAFGLIFLVLFYQNYFSKMKRREAEQLLRVSLESEKSERKRIAADLHDSVAADLSAIKNYLVLLQKQHHELQSIEGFGDIRESVDNALQNTRLISYKLMPPLLETFGLVAALQDNFERLHHKTAVPFLLRTEGMPVFAPTVSYEIFRIIQEFTANMLKYGGITACHVNICEKQEANTIEIKDDGKPYDFFELLKTTKGAGLVNITSRLKVIDAQLVQQKADTGNHFTITIKK